MKYLITILTILFFLTNVNSSIVPIEPTPSIKINIAKVGWELLGVRKVNFKGERDEIVVTGQKGTFTSLKLRVKKTGVNVKKMIVHFGNGQKQDIVLRQNIPAGGESRVIDLKGGKRIISKVVFYYDSKNNRARRATVELFGRH